MMSPEGSARSVDVPASAATNPTLPSSGSESSATNKRKRPPQDQHKHDSSEDDSSSDDEKEWRPRPYSEEKIAMMEARITEQLWEYANKGVEHLNKAGYNYELVRPGTGLCGSGNGLRCLLHTNFEVKEKDTPDAPVERYFAQINSTPGKGTVIELCIYLGPSHEISAAQFSRYCDFCNDDVYHPDGPIKGLYTGLEVDPKADYDDPTDAYEK